MNQTIYFRKNVWKVLEKETKKSELINYLLEVHYGIVVPGSFKQEVHADHVEASYQVEPLEKWSGAMPRSKKKL